ncbi:uncharacterized protein LOC141685383 [Apium graveolens]|uniref:uncharacterized protein LOC141685383 n=1 Tax=Apium graveolens TaxID=4045 RepID=UPI003D78F534
MARNCREPVQKVNVLRIVGPPLPETPTAQSRARTFNMTMKDAVQNVDVVAGTLVINSVEVEVLMDSGATRSFIAESVIDRLKCIAYLLETTLIIEVAIQERVTANRICPNCELLIDSDIQNKEAGKFLTAIQTKRLLRQGCEAYLAHVKDVEAESLRIKDIPVVKDFLDVFLDELPGLPPDREIEFMIDLAPGTEPVLKAPYRMAPVKMKELTIQLQELLNKGVIHLSVSPWADTLSRKEMLNVLTSFEELIKEFEKLEIEVRVLEFVNEATYAMTFQPEILEKIRYCQE